MFQAKVAEKIETRISCSTTIFYRSVCEMMWKNIVEPGRLQVTIRHMRISCWITTDTNTLSEYVILITLPLQDAQTRLNVHVTRTLHIVFCLCLPLPFCTITTPVFCASSQIFLTSFHLPYNPKRLVPHTIIVLRVEPMTLAHCVAPLSYPFGAGIFFYILAHPVFKM
jgi:hypothetical protein